MELKELKTRYDNMINMTDMRLIIEDMTTEQKQELKEAHELVKATTGLDMRQERFLSYLRC